MIHHLISLWQRFVKNWIVARDPQDDQISALHTNIAYIWASIDNAEHPHEFAIINSEIEMFAAKYANQGFEDFADILEGMAQHLDHRIDELQDLTNINHVI